MKLQELKYESCPVCGSIVTMEQRSHEHSNGHWNEEIKFKCGCEIRFSPNFMQKQILHQCPKHPNEILKTEKRNNASRKLEKYIMKLDVDDEFKHNVRIYGLKIF